MGHFSRVSIVVLILAMVAVPKVAAVACDYPAPDNVAPDLVVSGVATANGAPYKRGDTYYQIVSVNGTCSSENGSVISIGDKDILDVYVGVFVTNRSTQPVNSVTKFLGMILADPQLYLWFDTYGGFLDNFGEAPAPPSGCNYSYYHGWKFSQDEVLLMFLANMQYTWAEASIECSEGGWVNALVGVTVTVRDNNYNGSDGYTYNWTQQMVFNYQVTTHFTQLKESFWGEVADFLVLMIQDWTPVLVASIGALALIIKKLREVRRANV